MCHGGYYLITEGLASKYSSRVLDCPPDETTIAMFGCGIFRLVFKWSTIKWYVNTITRICEWFIHGNFYTHNNLYLSRVLEDVCYSNDIDRIVMSVDCTDIDTKWNQASFNFELKYLINTYCSTMIPLLILQLNSQITHFNRNICNNTTGSMDSINGKRLCYSSNINNNNRNDNASNYKSSSNSARVSIKSVRSCNVLNIVLMLLPEMQIEM